jgi:hypothetical protein
MNHTPLAVFVLAAIALALNANADYVSLNVDTNSSHWSLYRQGINLSFNSSSLVDGTVSPVQYHNRILSPYQSSYQEIGANDVRLRQRTSALEGRYRSSDEINMMSFTYPNQIEISVNKPSGSATYTIEYRNEMWPVILRADRSLEYSGQQINERDFEGNNGDFVGANFLYNHELFMNQSSLMWLQRANATVVATDNAILSAEFEPTKYLGNLIQAESTGIADLSYRQRDSQYDVKHQMYPSLNEGEERYYGTYDLARIIEMRSVFKRSDDIYDLDYYENADNLPNNWLPCYYGGWDNLAQSYQKDFGTDAKGVFDCTCYGKVLSS